MNVRTCTRCGADYLAGANALALCLKCRTLAAAPSPAPLPSIATATPPSAVPAVLPASSQVVARAPSSAPAKTLLAAAIAPTGPVLPAPSALPAASPPMSSSPATPLRPAATPVAKKSSARRAPAPAVKQRATMHVDRLPERSAAVLLALVVTALLGWMARPSSPHAVVAAPAAPEPMAVEIRLGRPPAGLTLAPQVEARLDPGPLVGSDHGDVVAEALAALPVAEGTTMTGRQGDDLTGNFLVPIGFTGDDPKTGLVLDPTGSGSGSPGKATFMGLEAVGRRFLIIADRSASMRGPKFQQLCDEITQTVQGLKSGAKFYVILYDSTAVPYPETRWMSGHRDAARLLQWLAGVGVGGQTNPLPAFEVAFTQLRPRPDAIFFMTDGLFDPGVADMIPTLNSGRRPVPIHSISFVDRAAEAWLRKIADDSKGTYRHVDLAAP